ncbi:hypothetical protein T492DRAFT_54450 [Pavlovales sp. CCMP2436]|nr:hypothetical protein T492DRAFT_54450 [Pavlovales sp. CCMP2436]
MATSPIYCRGKITRWTKVKKVKKVKKTDVLNQLDAAVHYVAAAMQARALPLAEVLPSVFSGLATVVRDGALGGFSELGVVQAYVSRIRAWFTRSLGDLEGTFEEVRTTVGLGVYEFSRDRHAHGAPYMSLVREGADTLSGSALDDFARRLGFVQRDEKGAGLRIREVLAEFLDYQKALEAMRELAALGHPLLDAGPIRRGVLAEPSDEVSRWASELKGEAVAWREQLAVARASHSYLLLLSTAEARALFAALGDASSSNSLRDLAVAYFPRFFLAALLPARSRQPTRQLRAKIRGFVRAFHGGAGAVPAALASWPEAVGNFASRLRAALDSPLPVRPAAAAEGSGDSSGVHVHNCDGAEPELLSRLLLHVYGGRMPEGFEVLFCARSTRASEIELFLQRACVHAQRTFALVRADLLSSGGQDVLTYFLLDRQRESEPVRLHCIVDGPSLIQPAPWIRMHQWGPSSVGASTLPSRAAAETSYRSGVVDGACVLSLRVVTSLAPGAGKTHLARKELARLGVDVVEVSISEAFDSSAIGLALCKHQLAQSHRGAPASAVLFKIQVGYYDSLAELACVLAPINQFFYELLVLRLVGGSTVDVPYALRADAGWHVIVEVPSLIGHAPGVSGAEQARWLRDIGLPALFYLSTELTPNLVYDLDDETRRVCKYLRAFSDGSINRKFGEGATLPKHIILLLDISGSMEGHKLNVAVDNLLRVYDSHVQPTDLLSLLLFDHETRVVLSAVEAQRADVRAAIEALRAVPTVGGTQMYSALVAAVEIARSAPIAGETWILCLTDGESSGHPDEATRQLQAAERLHVTIIGVALAGNRVAQMQALCRPRADSKGAYIASGESAAALQNAFATAASLLPVSQTFELDGALTDEACHALFAQYMPTHVTDARLGMLRQTFWVAYLHRRVLVFDQSDEFNYNLEHDNLGSTLMEIMLSEVDSALRTGQERAWKAEAHRQLIYDFSHPDGPKFSVICTMPDLLVAEERDKLRALGFELPTVEELATRECLDQYLARALSLSLDERGRIPAIDTFGFILTLDFAVKLLHIHERVACRRPCVIEGETGVSKTALTRMYALLVNSGARERARAAVRASLGVILEASGVGSVDETDLAALINQIRGVAAASRVAAVLVAAALLDACASIPPPGLPAPRELLEAAGAELTAMQEGEQAASVEGPLEAMLALLDWLGQATVHDCFVALNVHSALTPQDVRKSIAPALATACTLAAAEPPGHSASSVILFLDEVNTSSCMGVFKELILDRSFDGVPLPGNVVIIAACNPARSLTIQSAGVLRQDDYGRDWALGHYQVRALPGSLAAVKWSFGALGADQELEFVSRRLEQEAAFEQQADGALGEHERAAMARVICFSQEALRDFSEEHLRARIAAACPSLSATDVAAEAAERAKTAVSLRDVQRVFVFLRFFSACTELVGPRQASARRRALLLAVACVYYVRLDKTFRARFLKRMRELPGEQLEPLTLEVALGEAMSHVLANADVPRGIARTEGLKENVFLTFVCTHARVPLMIVGPPGSSKTLSMGVVEANARGVESPRGFFRAQPLVEVWFYQCSRRSTSSDIESVFTRAIERQRSALSRRCVVFMDEAGLPEERRESLKVLHYYLEGATPADRTPAVSFVAITNHVLDAAKSNRCACLLRGEPDLDDLNAIARGCLFEEDLAGGDVLGGAAVAGAASVVRPPGGGTPMLTHLVAGLPPECGQLAVGEMLKQLCCAYSELLHNASGEFGWFERSFGLRDFVHALRYLRRHSEASASGFRLTRQSLLLALARNFNGVEPALVHAVIGEFVARLFGRRVADSWVPTCLPSLVEVMEEAIHDCATGADSPRYLLLVDESPDDSALRMPRWHGLATPGSASAGSAAQSVVLKLSDFADDSMAAQVNLISAVKLAAAQGAFAELSGTEAVHECLYALFNQQLKTIVSKDGTPRQYANVAVGSYSKPCLVSTQFRCAVHLPVTELPSAPAAFLNRFEKYILASSDVLAARLTRLPAGVAHAMWAARRTVATFVEVVGAGALRGVVARQTVDSVMLDMLPPADLAAWLCAPAAPAVAAPGAAGSAGGAALCAAAVRCAAQHLVLRSCATAEELAVDGRASAASHDEALGAAWDRLAAEQDFDWPTHLCTASARGEGSSASASDWADELAGASGEEGVGEEEAVAVAVAALRHVLEREACERLLQLAPPETILAARHELPRSLLRAYFEQEHFSLPRLLERLCASGGLHAVHTRTTPAVQRLLERQAGSEASAAQAARLAELGLPPDLAVARLATFGTEEAFREAVRAWVGAPGEQPCLLLVADLTVVTPERVAFARIVAEECLRQSRSDPIRAIRSSRTLVLLIHSPPSRAAAQALQYPALFHAGWSHWALDGVGALPDGDVAAAGGSAACADARDAREWCALACGLRAKWDVAPCLLGCMPTAIRVAASRIRVRAPAAAGVSEGGSGSAQRELPAGERHALLLRFMRQRLHGSTVCELVCARFAREWDSRCVAQEVTTAAERLASGRLNLSLGEEVGGVLE